ncbi:hypothetical protein UO65_4476 [Actinokineospora spheciospongiae]|uniref:Uncharacterized protein n=1 Tax=Actinokineospora spheciospongiae TaxID=909613 RepID=W7IH65_9PSEU|nr:hypothetical protein [Actinokineospora spheciospongiae]EWC60230.1 hypothetical protein UO65_4476 [Actinokineospora spheciospongiae]
MSRARALLRRVAVTLGRSPDRDTASATCAQCGSRSSTVVHRLSRRRVGYWCTACTAVVTTGDLSVLDEPPPVPAEPVDPHAAVLAPPVLAWARTHAARLLDRPVLDRAAYKELHTRFDRAESPGLPGVSAVVGRLHESCYRTDRVTASFPAAPGLAERVEHARRWLARDARDLCWVISAETADHPPLDEVEKAAAAWAGGGPLDREQASALRTALFGTDGGPGCKVLLRSFDDTEVTAALDAYLGTRARPLRAATLTALDR